MEDNKKYQSADEYAELSLETRNFPDGSLVAILRPKGFMGGRLRPKLLEIIAKVSPHVLIDLSQVSFLDSSGLGSLAICKREIDKVNGSFRVYNFNDQIRQVFELTSFNVILKVFETEEEALNSFCDEQQVFDSDESLLKAEKL
ncbi:MAG: STAS domain-containing protein [Leptolyngbya sp. SIO1D8]|nr:STAS domain-containing protein [Leptolyngbya sp. SIO1D8]